MQGEHQVAQKLSSTTLPCHCFREKTLSSMSDKEKFGLALPSILRAIDESAAFIFKLTKLIHSMMKMEK